jgi:hypothetical protein
MEEILPRRRGQPPAWRSSPEPCVATRASASASALVLGLLIVVRFQSIGSTLPKRRLGLVDGGGWW